MNTTVRKIDFFGGLHGHYLELIVNIFIDQNKFDTSRPFFSSNGACHLKNLYHDYVPITKANHWSWFNMPFDEQDRVIQIFPKESDMLIGITNSFLRAGDQSVDIKNLEKNTLHKLSQCPKLETNLKQITSDFGHRDHYERQWLRNYFYSMFDDPENGIKKYQFFNPLVKHTYQFPFRAFFDWSDFFTQLTNIAKFVELEFKFDSKLVDLHIEFLKHNQGYHSEQKCKKIIESAILKESMLIDLNLIEEAWINYQLSCMFGIYNHPVLLNNQYPTDTLQLSEIIYKN
jgi:hypothetical protein